MKYPKSFQRFSQVFHSISRTILRSGEDLSTNPLSLLTLLTFYLVLILFPSNLAKSFILPQSYVKGVLIDYLSPSIYLIEVLVLLILVTSAWKKPQNKSFLISIILFLLALLPSVLLSAVPLVSAIRFAEIALWLGFGFWVAENIRWQKKGPILWLLGAGVLWVSILSILQFFLQRHIFGYWFLGEPLLKPSLAGVAKISFWGREVMRPYGTFPHPNVLGGVLSILFVWFWAGKRWFSSLASVAGVLVSFSRTALLSALGGFLGVLGFAGGGSFRGLVESNFLSSLSVSRRWELLGSAVEMWGSRPLVGIGLGLFTVSLPNFGIPSGLTLFLQPVHNIFALIASESGGPALIFFLLILVLAFRETIRRKRFLLTISLLQLVFLGFFDHYLYTLPQGLFVLSLTLGLSFSYSDK
ncbi:MAG: hypothetical protein BMS9Abin34_414 [Patescibacteria group bacterium]|nr:MAG: hypothetical protein BMS9Abin34_414 [Patescibacteria group bacterium]